MRGSAPAPRKKDSRGVLLDYLASERRGTPSLRYLLTHMRFFSGVMKPTYHFGFILEEELKTECNASITETPS